MKKRFYFVAMIAVLFLGCSSGSDGGSLPINETSLLGKWYLKGIKHNSEPLDPTEHSCPASKDFNEIFSNHHIIFTGYNTSCEVNDTQNSQWTLVGDVFSIIYSDGSTPPDVYKVMSITNTEMQMKQTSGSDSYVYYLNKL